MVVIILPPFSRPNRALCSSQKFVALHDLGLIPRAHHLTTPSVFCLSRSRVNSIARAPEPMVIFNLESPPFRIGEATSEEEFFVVLG